MLTRKRWPPGWNARRQQQARKVGWQLLCRPGLRQWYIAPCVHYIGRYASPPEAEAAVLSQLTRNRLACQAVEFLIEHNGYCYGVKLLRRACSLAGLSADGERPLQLPSYHTDPP